MTTLAEDISPNQWNVRIEGPISDGTPRYPQYFQIDDEKIRVHDGLTTTSWVVERGISGTTRTEHSAGTELVRYYPVASGVAPSSGTGDGLPGDKGPTGDAGEQGPIGEQGPAGPQGPEGEQGPVGDKGPQGDKGLTGDAGPVGDAGPTGDTGLTGDKGPVGDKGATGDTGLAGATGDKGPAGDKGLTGDKGPTGDQGPIGEQGPAGDAGTGGEAFPVGSVYLSVVSTDPGTLLGYGTWSRIAQGRFLVGVDQGVAEETGGAATHTHAAHTDVLNHTHGVTVTDPGHAHVENQNSATTGGLTGWGARDTSTNTSTATGYSTASATTGITATAANPAGGVASLTHDSASNLPPSLAVYMWKRTA